MNDTEGCIPIPLTPPHLAHLPVTGFVHKVSPVKQARNNSSYFNFTIQTDTHNIDSVCFEPQMHKLLHEKSENKKSVKLSNYSLKRSIMNKTASL